MGETFDGEKPNPLYVSIGIDYYEKFMRLRTLGVKSPEATAAYQDYKLHRDSLSEEEQSQLDDQILALERPDLAEAPTPASTPEPISSDHPDIVELKEKLDKRSENG